MVKGSVKLIHDIEEYVGLLYTLFTPYLVLNQDLHVFRKLQELYLDNTCSKRQKHADYVGQIVKKASNFYDIVCFIETLTPKYLLIFGKIHK